MGTTKQRIKGNAERVKGRAKQAVGRATGNRSQEIEGAGEARKGELRNKAARGVARAKGKATEIVGRVQQAAAGGKTRARGKKNEIKGRAQRNVNR
jgi:uncharacterized protein YjbJ (UPF0337 family)